MATALLLLVCWSSTVEIVHRHPSSSDKSDYALFQTTPQDSSGQNAPLADNCLLCQFHRQLSLTLLAVPLFIAPLTIQFFHRSPAPGLFSRLTCALKVGRAPPIISL
jgi:hypothetical protein